MNLTDQHQSPWPIGKKICFRFAFLYFFLYMAPWTWLDGIPGVSWATQYYYKVMDWVVETANHYFFNVREQLVPFNGSGDTSYGWAQLWLFLSVATFGCVLWSLLDRKRPHYQRLDYWLRTFVRYYIAMFALSYGIIKVFAMQMFFPSLSQLATPLGDFLPMRLSWMFIGYSTPYQVFAGAMEVLVGLLLLNRRTVTLGLLLGFGVFAHVVVLNYCYDIPVKLFSAHLMLCCLFLLAYDSKRLYELLILNKSIGQNSLYEFIFVKKWETIGRIFFKTVFIAVTIPLPLFNTYSYYISDKSKPESKPLSGIYDVIMYVVNGDTIPVTIGDSLRWKDIIFEKGGLGSVNSVDTLFRQRYRRGYFNFETDTVHHNIAIKKLVSDSTLLFTLHYSLHGQNNITVKTKIREDSIHLVLNKSKRHFQLAEKQFHWLSERNR